jgi:hypothetical protein
MKYPYRVNMEQNGEMWNVLIKKPEDMAYFIRNGYILRNAGLHL